MYLVVKLSKNDILFSISMILNLQDKDDFEFSSLLQHHDGVEEEDVSGSVPQSWAKFSKNNVEESQGNNCYCFEKNLCLDINVGNGP